MAEKLTNDAELTAAIQPQDYLRPIWQRKWLILAIVVIVTVAAYVYANGQPKRYETSTKIFFPGSGVVAILNPNGSSDPDRNIINQSTLLTSDDVASSVARDLHYPGGAGAVLSHVTATPSSGSDFIVITATDSTAQGAARIANAFARAFVRIRSNQLRTELNQQLTATTQQLQHVPRVASTATERANLASTIRQLRLAASLPSASVEQVDPAVASGFPVAPRPKRTAAFGFVLAALAAMALAFLLDRLDRRLKHAGDVEALYGLPVLGTIPHVDNPSPTIDGRASLPQELREPFRSLRTNVQLEAIDRPLRKLLVTSAVPGEGKSTVVRDLALAFRESGRRVVVVDADLRRSQQHRLFGLERSVGLTHVLVGSAALPDALISADTDLEGLETMATLQAHATVGGGAETLPAAPNANGHGDPADALAVLVSGVEPANPQAVLAADRTRQVLDELAATHDVVLVDSSPLLPVSDTVPLLAAVDGVLVVARINKTTRDDVSDLTGTLGRVPDANILGVVVNDVEPATGRRAGYYGYSS